MKKIAAIATMALGVLLLTGCSMKKNVPTEENTVKTTATSSGSVGAVTAATAPKNTIISIRSHGFNPAQLIIKAGETVTWTNMDTVSHTITSSDGTFDKILAKTASHTVTFDKPGTYVYRCSFHTNMTGTILVK